MRVARPGLSVGNDHFLTLTLQVTQKISLFCGSTRNIWPLSLGRSIATICRPARAGDWCERVYRDHSSGGTVQTTASPSPHLRIPAMYRSRLSRRTSGGLFRSELLQGNVHGGADEAVHAVVRPPITTQPRDPFVERVQDVEKLLIGGVVRFVQGVRRPLGKQLVLSCVGPRNCGCLR
jgi:hypothetical protein